MNKEIDSIEFFASPSEVYTLLNEIILQGKELVKKQRQYSKNSSEYMNIEELLKELSEKVKKIENQISFMKKG